MVTVQLAISDDERARVARQAERDGVTVAEWLTTAALQRLRQREGGHDGVRLRDSLPARYSKEPFKSDEELAEFWRHCAAINGPGREPDWEEHLKVINESRSKGLPDV